MIGSNVQPDPLTEKRIEWIPRRASWLQTAPPPSQRQRGRYVTARARRQGAISAPETCILHPTVSRLPVAGLFFLGSWMADICQEGHSLRSAPQRRHMAHLRRNRVTGTREVIKTCSPPGTVCLPSTLLPELLGPAKGKNAHPTTPVPLWSTWEPEWLRPGKCTKAGPTLESAPKEHPGAWAV